MSRPRADLDQVFEAVKQLSKDRKNEFGGYAGGLMNMEELGPHQGGNWPLTAEFIKRRFGQPKDRDHPELSQYVETLRGASHTRLEEMVERLRRLYPELYRKYNAVFNQDLAGDRDYEYLVGLTRGERPKPPEQLQGVSPTERCYKKIKKEKGEGPSGVPELEPPPEAPKWLKARPTGIKKEPDHQKVASEFKSKVDDALMMLAHWLRDDDLVVEFAKARTLREDKKLEDRDRAIYFRYGDLRDGGKRPKVCKEIIAEAEGLSVRRVEQIVESQRGMLGEGQRGQGRPKKEGR